MNAAQRRGGILDALRCADGPVSATTLAARLSVSRQIIVGDVAILRAGGADISATPRGYVLGSDSPGLLFTVACLHSADDMERELNLMVDNGCVVLDVVVEHHLYGQLTGPLQLSSRYDISQFIQKVSESNAKPLSDLTHGIHLHTLRCPDQATFLRTRDALAAAGFLYQD